MIGTRPAPKPGKPLVSHALRQSARDRSCTLRWACDGSDVVLCHIRGIWSGIGQKPSDIHALYGCGGCNTAMAGANRPPAEEVLRAMIETQTIMLAEGLISARGAR